MVKYDQICFDQKTNQKNTMKAAKLLHKMLEKTCPDIHKTRLNALMAGVLSGVSHHQIMLIGLQYREKVSFNYYGCLFRWVVEL